MLFKILDTLRTKPTETRRQVAFLAALTFTFLIGGVWSLSLPARFADRGEEASEGTKPFAGLFSGFRDQFGFLKQQATAITSAISSSTATSTDETATTSDLIDLNALLSSTTLEVAPKPVILIGTTSATGTVE